MGQQQNDSQIIRACFNNDVATVASLLRSGHDPNERDSKGRTGVHLACIRGNLELIKLLFQYGSDLNAVDYHGNTAFHFCGHLNIVNFLCEHNVSAIKPNNRGLSPLDMALRRGINPDALNFIKKLNYNECPKDSFKSGITISLPSVNSYSKKKFKHLWFQFCLDLGAVKLTVLLIILLCLSLFIAYQSMTMSKLLDSRIPIEDEYTHKTEL